MIPATFEYVRASSIDEAIDLLGRSDEARVLAGGQSLLPLMRFRLATPGTLVDIGGLRELNGIGREDGGWRIGATTTYRQLLDDDVDLVAELVADQRAADVGAILVTVADDDAAGPRESEHGRQLRLAAGLDADTLAAMRDDFLDDVALLIDLDRIDRGVATAISEFVDDGRERAGQLIDAVMQDVDEAHQHRAPVAPRHGAEVICCSRGDRVPGMAV